MFDRLSDRIATAVATGLDVAVEFATLGEYRLAVTPDPGFGPIAPPRPLTAPRVFDGSPLCAPNPDAALPRPATAAVRGAAQAEGVPVPALMAACSSARTHAGGPDRAAARRRARSRGGSIEAPVQLCLWPPAGS